MEWYRVLLYRAHVGAGRLDSGTVFIFAEDVISAYKRYGRLPGVKRDKTPNISPLSLEESVELEKKIVEERRISLDRARKSWYFER